MLNALFGSEARVKILNIFLLHPEAKYSISQIAGSLKLPANSVRREIDNILKFGLIIATIGQEGDKVENKKKAKKIEKKYFTVNTNFVLYPEIKALLIKAQILSSEKFILSAQKDFQPKLLILTGFFTNQSEAQTDILIVGAIKRPAFLKLIAELEKDFDREINFTILDEKEYKYRHEIMDIFLYSILDNENLVLIDNILHK